MKSNVLAHFENAKVLVIGDVMLDRNWHGETKRISPEAPVPVVKVQVCEDSPGGAANVAKNIATLNAQTTLLGVIGEDHEGEILKQKMHEANVRCFFQALANCPTITKLRILSLHQQLIRLDFEESYARYAKDQLLQYYLEQIKLHQALIISDYQKGTLTDLHQLITHAAACQVPIFIDPKNQDFSIYAGAYLLTPNRHEFENVVGVCHSEQQLEEKARQLIKDSGIQNLLITRGAEGMSLIPSDAPALHLPAIAQEVYDVTGAGDTVIAVLATAVASGQDLADAMFLANTAAGIVVSKLGTATVSPSELRLALRRQSNTKMGILSEDEAIQMIEDAKSHGEVVVMTNGCFDILHAGHIQYLEEAKALGHRLVVAVNSSESVARLKGPHRPINSLDDRMALLASLQMVDWVVSFSEDTPERLIRNLKPDVLVKGGDYDKSKLHEIAGAEFTLSRGGTVKILSFLPNHSTTNIVNKITMTHATINEE